MRRRTAGREVSMGVRTACAIAGVLALFGAGCASPDSRFYTLSAAPAPGAAPSTLSVVVGPVSVPAAVDRPQIVVTVGPNQVRLDEFNRWEPRCRTPSRAWSLRISSRCWARPG